MDSLIAKQGALILAGSLLLCFGGAVTTVAAFQNRFLPTYVGFVMFSMGYRVAQIGAHETNSGQLYTFSMKNLCTRGFLIKYGLLTIGIGIAAYGGVIGAQSVSSLAIDQMILSGVCMSGGYIIGHIGLNKSYV